MLHAVLQHARDHQSQHLDTLFDFLRIPSISTLPEHEPDILQAAQWLVSHLSEIGMQRAEIMPTAGLPVVYAEWLDAGPDAPTVLVYGHYDVQPVDPVEEWQSPPFEPTVRDGNIYCRGASDDKGQSFAVLAAADSYLRATGSLPLNLKVLLEAEEEISSPNLTPWVRQHRAMLAADAVLICDTSMLDETTPLIMTGTRGMAYMQIDVQGPSGDLHSGGYGGAVDNPFNVLVRLLAQLQDGDTHRVLIPGFYDKVQVIDPVELESMRRIPFDDDRVRADTGVPAAAGETGYSIIERLSIRPTLDIHGIPGGFTGAGKKTVIPARASAKLSMRLVPDQNPEEIASLFESYVRAICPPTVVVTVHRLGMARPSVVDYRHPVIQAAARALEESFSVAPLYLRGGGTLPIVPDFQDILGVPVVMAGFGLPNDNAHAPNEKLGLRNFRLGVEMVIRYFALLGQDVNPDSAGM